MFSNSQLVVLVVSIFFAKFYKTFYKKNQELYHYANPTYYIYFAGKFATITQNIDFVNDVSKIRGKSLGRK